MRNLSVTPADVTATTSGNIAASTELGLLTKYVQLSICTVEPQSDSDGSASELAIVLHIAHRPECHRSTN